MKKRLVPAVLAMFMIILAACQKDVNDLTPEEIEKCKIETGYYYGGSGGLNDSANFIYAANGKLSKVETEYERVEYFYNGDKISVRKFYDKLSGELVYEDSIHYTGNNISRIIGNDYGSFGLDSISYHYMLDYQGDRLSMVRYFEPGNPFNNDTFATVVHTNAAGNIEKMVYLDEFDEPYDSVAYQFDANQNYFKKVHPHFILFDPFFQLQAGFEPHLAYFYSTNNVTGFTIYAGQNYQVSYDLDASKNISGVKMDGDDYMRYRFKCQ